MLSYLHAFHAGNFADVQKHAALTLTMSMMQAKPSGIACIDTHAGSAVYDLNSDRARKTAEADDGIRKVWAARGSLASADWQPMLSVLSGLNPASDDLNRYPGSPAWFAHFLRADDTLTTFELHPTEGARLEEWASARGIKVRQEDGLKGMFRLLPPRQPRLLVLMDPSYEIKSDYQAVASALAKAWKKCRHGVYLIWYPVLTSGLEKGLLEGVEQGPVRKVLRSEVHLDHPPERGMTGSGMLMVNPPWGLSERLSAMMDDVSGREALGVTHRLDWLVPE
ncbi:MULTISPECIES: 23S rRNA (adenine(2030)-N(6))-methyltransferase RlmJ [Marinobacter]|uniref:Ribosomal RNA large subunit methyltransferase J n=1 Tax=Marinobacter suaedae TaxID=3057675 RepID=A0ABT8VWV3_9GAMM|nr:MULTISPECIES: 23S rRNA (adenine(2030)-N(6))-methyltransferase RlmJ [unclassified Marinobacter]MBZ2168584.1 23S rRNA (adenine(2030)-N(6))-methyltransferase RlmJ [Marinobacter sp. F4216]MDO3720481.1 23S rRNA (adenine(2030)-N(6))-methyltransferase RlmJ [Marinobacter sp. chi1]